MARAVLAGALVAGCSAQSPEPASAQAAPVQASRPPADLDKVGPVTGCSRTVVFVLDRSGSMVGLPFEMGKSAAKTVVASLTSTDCFGLIAFDSKAMLEIPVAHIDRTIEARIGRVNAGGGTDLAPALELAHASAAATDAKRRFVLLLTDDDVESSKYSSPARLHELARAMANEEIELSTVGLGEQVDAPLLQALARTTGGHSTFVVDPEELPNVVEKELKLANTRKR